MDQKTRAPFKGCTLMYSVQAVYVQDSIYGRWLYGKILLLTEKFVIDFLPHVLFYKTKRVKKRGGGKFYTKGISQTRGY